MSLTLEEDAQPADDGAQESHSLTPTTRQLNQLDEDPIIGDGNNHEMRPFYQSLNAALREAPSIYDHLTDAGVKSAPTASSEYELIHDVRSAQF
jgi:hypothetical protein